MDATFPPPVFLPLEAQPLQPFVEPVQRIGEFSLTMPLSADMTFVRHVAELADKPDIYAVMSSACVVAMGLGSAIVGRPPSFSEIGKTFNTAILTGAALMVVSMVSTLPIGIAVLISGLLGATGAAMLFVASVFRGLDLVFEWISRWAAAKPALYRSTPWLLVCLLFTRPWFRRTAFVAGLALSAPAILTHFPPFLLFGVPMIVASLIPRQKWQRQARAEFRMAKALLDRTRLSHPVTP
jgi:hypothetical protein